MQAEQRKQDHFLIPAVNLWSDVILQIKTPDADYMLILGGYGV